MRRFLFLIAFVFAALPAAAAERVVNVYNWSDYIDPKTLEDFTQETGIKIVYDTFDSNEILETKLLAGKSGYDVVVPSASFLQRQIQAGIFRKLDKSKLPNLKYAWPVVTARLATYDPGNEHAVNYMWGTTGIGYNVKASKELGQPVDSWDVIFKPELISKFKDCGINMLDAPEELIPAAMNYLGLSPDSKKPEDIEKAGALLEKIRPFVKKFNSSEYINSLASGEICLTVGWSGDVFQAKKRALEAAENTKTKPVEVDYALPKEGTLMWFDSFAIPKDAEHVEEAHAFINFMLRPEIAARNSNAVTYANGNLESQKLIDKDILNNPSVYPPPEVLAKLYTVTSNAQDVQRVITRVWTKFKTGM
ncbi:MAG TPA: polyamine ABC transporter substrate-binding protein [Xanthobacteraceae bacterium]|nr:polyamine ABC transporter substrate-binding protein [Xanthobacteraceae bacterium]